MPEGILKAIAHPTHQALLSLLAVEPSFPRRLAALLSLSEEDVARRLKAMEGIGLLKSEWAHVGKNVKLYRLNAEGLTVRFARDGIRLELVGSDGTKTRPPVDPFELRPPEPGPFFGRSAELAVLGGQERVGVVEGMPGIGKTSLLVQFAASVTGTHSVFWYPFRGVESFTWFANRLGLFFAQNGDRKLLEAIERGAEAADRREILLKALDDPRYVLVLDDVQKIEDEAVRSVLFDAAATVKKAKLVFATRGPLRPFGRAAGGAKTIRLAGLTDADVALYLQHHNVQVDPKLYPKLRDEVGGHPLALGLLVEAARDANKPIAEFLDRVPERDLEEWLLQEVYDHLDEEDRRLLSLASVFRTRFTADALSTLATRNVENAWAHLLRKQLIESYDGRYQLHEVVRNFIYHRLQDKDRLHAKAAEHYLGLRTLEGRLEALHHFLAAHRRDRVLELLGQDLDLKEFDFIDAGYQNLYLSVLDLFQRADVKDPRRWALIQDEKGDIHLHRGDPSKALAFYDEADAHFRKEKDRPRIADLSWKRAMALHRLGRTTEATRLCADALKEAPTTGLQKERLMELQTQLRPAG